MGAKPITILVAASKGGSGKTTLAVHLAVLASLSRSVVLVDLDDQRSVASWWRRRRGETPGLVEGEPSQLADVQVEAGRRGVQLLVVDTAPRVEGLPLARLSSFVLVPSRPGVLDLEAVGRSVEEVSRSGTPGAIVLNGCPPGRGVREASIVSEARAALAGSALPVADVSLGLRAAMTYAILAGKGLCEYEPEGKAAQEVAKLWKWIERLLP